ncbi:MAG: phenylalanine--tRNA ligase subunit beta [Leptospira sp.]|nr:phenylalanine--tRNA ligase subunit beta [Leptospira sp.]
MKLSYDWLNDFVELKSIPMETILDKINTSVCEIDSAEENMPHLRSIVAVKVESIEKHPDADRLSVCIVSDGKKKLTVVTAATGLEKEDLLPLALPGTTLNGQQIKVNVLKGIESFGMFCSEKDLGFSEDNSNVFRMDKLSKLGSDLLTLFALNDIILTIDNKSITHRPDLWSHFGFARELSAQLRLPLKFNPFDSVFSFELKEDISVIENQNAHSYFASLIKNVRISASDFKIKSRLERCGIRSINNVVDVSNYVMLEMGQPTHFFDRKKFRNIRIEVSFAKEKEKISLLDGSEKELNERILLIRNEGQPVAIAGIMGGSESSVSESTDELVLESAVFKREDIRKSSKETGIRSEAAMRYEKGLDSHSSLPVIARSLLLLKENGCENISATAPVGFDNASGKKFQISTTFSFICRKIGKQIQNNDILDILSRLGFSTDSKDDSLVITVPRFRHNYDITIPEDIVEEIGRTIGYKEVEQSALASVLSPPISNERRLLERRLKSFFSMNLRYSEVYNYSFASDSDVKFENDGKEPVSIVNTMPVEYRFLRNSMYPSIFRNVATNADRFELIRIFELGRVYRGTKKGDLPNERKYFVFAFAPNRKQNDLRILFEDDFLKSRNEMENLFRFLNIQKYELKNEDIPYFHPNCSLTFSCNGKRIAEIGFLHPKWMDAYGIKKRLIVGQIDFEELYQTYVLEKSKKYFKPPSMYPQDQIDVSVLMNESDETNSFGELVKKSDIPEFEAIWVNDIYRGVNLGENKKSVTYRISLLTYEKTFTQDRVKKINSDIIELGKKHNFQIR